MKWAIIFGTLLAICLAKPLHKSRLKRLPHKCLRVAAVPVEENIKEITAKVSAEALQALGTSSFAPALSEGSESPIMAEQLVEAATTEMSANSESLATTDIAERTNEFKEASSISTILTAAALETPSAAETPSAPEVSVNQRSDQSAESAATTLEPEPFATTEASTVIERLNVSEESDLTTFGSEHKTAAATDTLCAVECFNESEHSDRKTSVFKLENIAATDAPFVVARLNEFEEIDAKTATSHLEVIATTEDPFVSKGQNEPQYLDATTVDSIELAATEPASVDYGSIEPEAAIKVSDAVSAPEIPAPTESTSSQATNYLGNAGEVKEPDVGTKVLVVLEAPGSKNPRESFSAPKHPSSSETPISEASVEPSALSKSLFLEAPTAFKRSDEPMESSLASIGPSQLTSTRKPLQQFITFSFFDKSSKNSSFRQFLHYLRSLRK